MRFKRATSEPELIDAPADRIFIDDYRLAALALEWSNRKWGGTKILIRALADLVRHHKLSGFTVLDAGCGSGDVDEALVRWCHERELAVSLLAVDSHPHAVTLAKERLAEHPEVKVVHADFFEAKFSDASFDFVVSSLVLHHLTEEQLGYFLYKAYKLARLGVVLTDLRRSLPAYLFASRILPALAPKSPVFRHDAPLSFRRAYTLREMRDLLVRGSHPYMATVPWMSPFRMVLTAEHLRVERTGKPERR